MAAGPALDLACGRGRHALAVAEQGGRAVAMDRNLEALTGLQSEAVARGLPVYPVRTDLETEHGIPAGNGSFGAVLVFRFLFRPLAPEILRVLRPDGWLLYETFTRRHLEYGYGPSNPAFFLDTGELPELFSELEVVRYEEVIVGQERPEAMARLLARRRGI